MTQRNTRCGESGKNTKTEIELKTKPNHKYLVNMFEELAWKSSLTVEATRDETKQIQTDTAGRRPVLQRPRTMLFTVRDR